MTIDYVVNQVETVVRKVGSRDPYVICNELDYKLHYASTRFSACGGARQRHSSFPPQCDPRGPSHLKGW